jgi:hypothetical protein
LIHCQIQRLFAQQDSDRFISSAKELTLQSVMNSSTVRYSLDNFTDENGDVISIQNILWGRRMCLAESLVIDSVPLSHLGLI